MVKIAPSILSANFARLGEDVRTAETGGADYLHIDVMDGHFVPNITIGPVVVAAIRPLSKLVFDVHLMIEQPEKYIAAFAESGADIITVHAEASVHLDRLLRFIRQHGVRAGVALNPSTPLSAIEYVLSLVDQVLLMTVNPGFGGQSFIPEVLPKIGQLKRMLTERNLAADIEVDGGITPETAPLAVSAGAGILVAGSSVYQSPDGVQEAIRRLRESCSK